MVRNRKRRTHRRLAGIENLEDRRMMTTTYMLLDFTHDGNRGSLQDTYFSVKNQQGYAPSFLDTNQDGWVTTGDVEAAAGQIASRVAEIFDPYHDGEVQVYYGDVDRNTNLGQQWLDAGRQMPDAHVMVMYFGGRDGQGLGDGRSAWGWAPRANDNYNVEGTGETLTTEIANAMVNSGRNVTPQEYIDRVAAVAAHEYGHMLGLDHGTNHHNNIMDTNSTAMINDPGNAGFPWEWVWTSTNNWQHPGYEVWKSFHYDSSQQVASSYSAVPFAGLDSSVVVSHDHHHDEHGHHHDEHGHHHDGHHHDGHHHDGHHHDGHTDALTSEDLPLGVNAEDRLQFELFVQDMASPRSPQGVTLALDGLTGINLFQQSVGVHDLPVTTVSEDTNVAVVLLTSAATDFRNEVFAATDRDEWDFDEMLSDRRATPRTTTALVDIPRTQRTLRTPRTPQTDDLLESIAWRRRDDRPSESARDLLISQLFSDDLISTEWGRDIG